MATFEILVFLAGNFETITDFPVDGRAVCPSQIRLPSETRHRFEDQWQRRYASPRMIDENQLPPNCNSFIIQINDQLYFYFKVCRSTVY